MPEAVCIKAGGLDDKAARDFRKTGVEFYCKDRMGYAAAVEGAEQKPVSLIFAFVLFFFLFFFFLLGFVSFRFPLWISWGFMLRVGDERR